MSALLTSSLRTLPTGSSLVIMGCGLHCSDEKPQCLDDLLLFKSLMVCLKYLDLESYENAMQSSWIFNLS